MLDCDPLDTCPYTLPLGPEQFAVALRSGHGRAVQHVLAYGATGFDDLIVNACLHNQAYDAQCEGSRAAWMLQIAEAAGLEKRVAREVAAALRAGANDDGIWDVSQCTRLALYFAERGEGDARSALYAACGKTSDGADLVAAHEIIGLDGADGLLFVAERLGERLVKSPESQIDDFPIRWYDEQHGKGAARRILAAAAAQHAHVSAYLRHIEDARGKLRGRRRRIDNIPKSWFEEPRKRPSIHSMSADDVLRDIDAGAPGKAKFFYRSWGMRTSESALQAIAARLFQETNPDRLARLLAVFMARPFPLFDARTVRFADHADRDVRWAAYAALANHAHPDVRKLALDRLNAERFEERELMLFKLNLRPGDWALIRHSLEWPADTERLHSLLSDVQDVFGLAPSEEAVEPLLLVYERTPCAICRHCAVNALDRSGRVPPWVAEECRYDVDPRAGAAASESG